jgi:hypothetical protein
VTDTGDNNVTLVINTGDINLSQVGTYYVYYNATDNAGNQAVEQTRTIRVVDTTGPVVILSGANPQIIQVHGSFVDLGADWSDNYDGSGHITATSGSVNVNIVGDYVLEYTKIDANGNTGNTVTRTVHIVDTTVPVLSIKPGTDTIEVYSGRTDA